MSSTDIQLPWNTIQYKNPCPSTLEYIGKKMIDHRFENFKNKYSTEQINMLTHFKHMQISSVQYDNKEPWTLELAMNQEPYATHMLYQSHFDGGTVRIVKPGYYILAEDIEFCPDPRGDKSFMPTDEQIQSGDYPTSNTMPTGYYGMGFFAAITIEAKDVVLNLNGKVLKQCKLHKLQQRFFACIELASAPFTQGAGGNPNRSKGPHNFAPTPVTTAENLYICNGTLGASSHHGIHGNDAVNIVLENMTIADFEVGAIQINGGKHVIIRNINVSTGAQDVQVNFKYSQARFIQRFLKLIEKEYPNLTLTVNGAVKTRKTITDRLTAAMKEVVDCIEENKEISDTSDAAVFKLHNAGGHLDGNAYGIVLAQRGPVVGNFAPTRNEMGINEDIVVHDVEVENLESDAKEILACSSNKEDPNSDSAYGGARVAGPAGDVLDIEFSTDNVGKYKSNVLIDAQLLLGKAVAEGLSNKGTSNVPNELIEWAEKGKTINSIIDGKKFCYIGFGDCMGHHMKGNIGVFIQGGKNVALFDSSIVNMQNYSKMGTQYGKYPGYHQGDTERVYMGTQNTGIAVVGCENVDLCNFKIDTIGSSHGVSNGINCIGMNKNVCIFNYQMQDIVCGKPSQQGKKPNPMLRCNMIKIADECYDEVSCSGNNI